MFDYEKLRSCFLKKSEGELLKVLSSEIGLSMGVISQIKNGHEPSHIVTIIKLCNWLKKDINSFINTKKV